MESFFIRHTYGLGVVEEAIDYLWKKDKIAIHFPDVKPRTSKEIPDKTTRTALRIVEEMRTDNTFKHKSPSAISAAALYLACQRTSQRATQKSFADLFGVSEVTIRNITKSWSDFEQHSKLVA